MADIKNIDVFQTISSVSFEVEPNTDIININKVTIIGSSGGSQDLQSVTDLGATTNNTVYINPTLDTNGLEINATGDGAGLRAIAQGGVGIYGQSNDTAFAGNGDTGMYLIGGVQGITVFANGDNVASLNQGLTAKGLVINSGTSSSGNFVELNKNGVDKLIVNQAGELTATKLIKEGGTSSQFLMADGSTSTGVSGATNLTTSQTSTNFTINSDTGTDASVPLGNGTLAGATLNDYTTSEKNKLSGIAAGAEVNVNADWNAVSGDAQILNKPSISGLATVTYVDTQDALKENYLSVPAANGYVLSSTTTGVRSWVAQSGGGGGGGDMFKSTYDTDNSGVVDNAEGISIIGRNSTGVTLYKGTIVYISGSTGNRPNFVKAQANSEATSAGTFGVIQNDISNNADGYCTTLGYLDNLDTRSTATHPFTSDILADGDTIYLSPTTAGYITNVKPSAPNHLVYIGKVARTSPTNGTIIYRIQNGYELEELHNVAISSIADKQLLSYDSATSLWKNKSVTTADIATSTNKNYVTDAQATVIGNTSGTNTGDQTLSGLGGVASNTAITAATNTKITYDSKGLVTAGTSLIASDIPNIAQSQVTSLTTDLGLKQDKSLSAYKLIANNTNATANGTEQVYKDIAEATDLSTVSTITWTGTTAPTSPISLNYKWNQIGSLVIARFNLVYTTAGSTITQLTITLPSTMPTPLSPTGFTAASDVLYQIIGNFGGSKAISGAMPTGSALRRNAANNGYELVIVRSAAAVNSAQLTVQYFT